MRTQSTAKPVARPSFAVSALIFVVAVGAMALFRLIGFHEHFLTLSYGVPLLICLWHRDRALLWAMTLAFLFMASYKAFWLVSMPDDSFKFLQWAMQIVNVLIIAAVIHLVLNLNQRLEAKRARLEAAHTELWARQEEITRQNEELQAQSEEIFEQNEELRTQTEELEQQAEELASQAEDLHATNDELARREHLLDVMLSFRYSLSAEPEVLGRLCVEGLKLIGGDVAGAAVTEARGDSLCVHAQTGLRTDAGALKSWPLSQSLARVVIRENRLASLNDTLLRPDLIFPQPAEGAPFRSVIAAPITVGGRQTGAVEFYSTEPRPWTEAQFRSAQWIAARCSSVLEMMRLRAEALQNQERYRQLFEASQEGLVLYELSLERASARFLQVNPAACALLGYTHQELLERSPGEVLHEIGPAEPNQGSPGCSALAQKTLARKDGTEFDAEVHTTWFEDAGVSYALSSIRDITVRKRSEAALREGQEQIRRSRQVLYDLVERAPFGIYIVDSAFRIVEMNAGSQTGTFRNVRPVLGRDLAEAMRILWPEPIAATIIAAFRKTLETGESFCSPRFINPRQDLGTVESYEWELHRMTLPDGQHGVVCYYYDSTKLREAEDLARSSEQRLAMALEGGQMGLWEWDLAADKCVWNAKEYELLGLPHDNGRPAAAMFFKQLHPDDAGAVERAMREAAGRRQPWHQEFRVLRPDGQVRWLAGAAHVALDGEGCSERLVGVHYDITARKDFQNELERLVVERTAKLHELVGELEHFSYTITHDMRAPLRSMRGFAELAQELCASCGQAEQKALLERVITSAARMDLLITDALSYSQAVRQQMPLGPVDLGALLRGMLDSYPEFRASRARIKITGDLPLVLGNQAGLTQVFSNLIGNAIKFAKAGHIPDIDIWAQHIPQDPSDGRRTPASRPRGAGRLGNGKDSGSDPQSQDFPNLHPSAVGWVRVWVEDAGIGISDSMLPRLFSMFARGSTGHEGTGIGLALVRKVVDRMGGRIGVLSKEGQGSSFWIELLPGDRRQPIGTVLPSPPPITAKVL